MPTILERSDESLMKPLSITAYTSGLVSRISKVQIHKSVHVLCILFVLLQIGFSQVEARSTLLNPTVTSFHNFHHRWPTVLSSGIAKANNKGNPKVEKMQNQRGNNSTNNNNSNSNSVDFNINSRDRRETTDKNILRRIVRAATTQNLVRTNTTHVSTSGESMGRFASRTLDSTNFL